MIILLAPEKIVTSTHKSQWEALRNCNVTLFTSKTEQYCNLLEDWKGGVFNHIEFFSNYASNDMIEMKLLEYAQQFEITNIIPMTEADVLRVALLKERLVIEGLKFSDALKFRDKILMKEIAQDHNINVPRFKRIRHSIDVLDFVSEVGFPFIIKPIQGRGSLNTLRINSRKELETLLNDGYLSDTSRYPDLLGEEYLEAEIYHIDGLQLNNKVEAISVSKYVNNCLSFVNGSCLGSYTLSLNSSLRTRLVEFSNHLLNDVYPLYKNAIFHIEVFVDKNEKFSLCEIACRLGGNGINDEVKLQQGIDIKMEYIKAECGVKSGIVSTTEQTYQVAGRLLIPPRDGRLLSIPETCHVDGVIKYQSRGYAGQIYKKMTMSNDEIANFLIKGGNENEMCEKITQLSQWFNEQVVWEN